MGYVLLFDAWQIAPQALPGHFCAPRECVG
jgi:hypothetical protein